MSRSFKSDYTFGKTKEAQYYDAIKNYFNDSVIQTTARYEKWDFIGDKAVYELKSRYNNHNTYPDTMIGLDKVSTTDKEIVFLFGFYDGLYYIKYDKDLFKTFTIRNFQRNNRTDHKDTDKPYIFIPIDKLIQIPL
jgi:hypothetical protein